MKKKKYWQKATEKMKICPMSEKTGENAKRPDRKGGVIHFIIAFIENQFF